MNGIAMNFTRTFDETDHGCLLENMTRSCLGSPKGLPSSPEKEL